LCVQTIFMKYATLVVLAVLIIFSGCKKNPGNGTQIVPIEAGLKANFGYQPGTYWIYKDSVSGETDSAYVYASSLDSQYLGCVLFAGQPKFQGMTVSVMVSNNHAIDTERWNFFIQDSTFYINFYNNNDIVESRMNLALFQYPFALGNLGVVGCEPNGDNGSVADIIPEVSENGQSYTNAARSVHSASGGYANLVYNDCFYANQDAGLVKIVFDHPTDSVNRVLQLIRYHLVR